MLANPPYSIKEWNREMFASDPYGRNIWGTPPQGRADYAFFQHIVCSMKPDTGRCAILFPHGVLFRNEEQDMRTKLVESDCIEAIIGLGPNLFYNSPMESCIVVCRTRKAAALRGKILFIDAVDQVERKNAQSYLTSQHIDKIVAAYESGKDQDQFSAIVDLADIRSHGYSLSIPLYVKKSSATPEGLPSLRECYESWRSASDLQKSRCKIYTWSTLLTVSGL